MPSLSVMTEQQFASAMKRLSRKHKAMLLAAMGNPPRVKNIPASLWKQIEKENAEILMLLLAAAAMASLRFELNNLEATRINLDVTPAEWRESIESEVETRARRAAEWTTRTSRNRLRTRERENGESTPDDLEEVISAERLEQIAANERRAGDSAGRTVFRDRTRENGQAVTHIWRLGPCQHCKVCPMLDGTTDRFWRRFTAGPPLHPHCCCEVETHYDTATNLIRSGIARRPPSGAQLAKAIADSGFDKFTR